MTFTSNPLMRSCIRSCSLMQNCLRFQLRNFDPRSCVFAVTQTGKHAEASGLQFPHANSALGVIPISLRPFVNIEEGTYTMPTSITGWLSAQGLGDTARIEQWDAIEEQMHHTVGVANTLQDLAELDSSTIREIATKMELHASMVESLVEAHHQLHGLTVDSVMLQLAGLGAPDLFGDSIKGKLSPPSDINITEGERRKMGIPADATHFLFAYQGDGIDLEEISDAQKAANSKNTSNLLYASRLTNRGACGLQRLTRTPVSLLSARSAASSMCAPVALARDL